MLFFEHGLGGGQGLLHARRFERRLPGISRREQDADDDGGQEAETVNGRQDKGLSGDPRQVERPEGEADTGQQGHRHHDQAVPRRQVGGRHGRRRDQHQAERIVQAPGHAQQHGQLQGVEGQLQDGFPAAHSLRRPAAEAQQDIEPDTGHDDAQGQPQVDVELEGKSDQEDHGALAADGQPAQHDECAQTQVILFGRNGGRNRRTLAPCGIWAV